MGKNIILVLIIVSALIVISFSIALAQDGNYDSNRGYYHNMMGGMRNRVNQTRSRGEAKGYQHWNGHFNHMERMDNINGYNRPCDEYHMSPMYRREDVKR